MGILVVHTSGGNPVSMSVTVMLSWPSTITPLRALIVSTAQQRLPVYFKPMVCFLTVAISGQSCTANSGPVISQSPQVAVMLQFVAGSRILKSTNSALPAVNQNSLRMKSLKNLHRIFNCNITFCASYMTKGLVFNENHMISQMYVHKVLKCNSYSFHRCPQWQFHQVKKHH